MGCHGLWLVAMVAMGCDPTTLISVNNACNPSLLPATPALQIRFTDLLERFSANARAGRGTRRPRAQELRAVLEKMSATGLTRVRKEHGSSSAAEYVYRNDYVDEKSLKLAGDRFLA